MKPTLSSLAHRRGGLTLYWSIVMKKSHKNNYRVLYHDYENDCIRVGVTIYDTMGEAVQSVKLLNDRSDVKGINMYSGDKLTETVMIGGLI